MAMAAQLRIGEIFTHVQHHNTYPETLTPEQCADVAGFLQWVQSHPELYNPDLTLKQALKLMAEHPPQDTTETNTIDTTETAASDANSAQETQEESSEETPDGGGEQAGVDLVDPERVGNAVVDSNEFFDGEKRRGGPPIATPLPPADLPNDPRRTPVHGNSNVRNTLGLTITPADNCHHLNNWKGGCCVIKAHEACPFLQGHQKECESYTPKRETSNRSRWGSRRGSA